MLTRYTDKLVTGVYFVIGTFKERPHFIHYILFTHHIFSNILVHRIKYIHVRKLLTIELRDYIKGE